ncbi:hypothetical protein CR513_25330, partial [Mucuna pruriens]
MDKTLVAARHLISNMASTASNQRLENQLTELTSLVRQLAVSQHQPAMVAKICGICTSVEHPIDMCPTLQETDWLSTAESSISSTSLPTAAIEITHARQFTISRRFNEAASDNRPGSSNLPSQTIPNPRGNASAVTLKNNKELPQLAQQQTPKSAKADTEAITNSQSYLEIVVPLPFPSWTISARKPESDEELLKMFRKVEINIPLLDAIKQILKYAKFLKELCVHKRRKMKGSQEFGGVVSALTKSDSTTGISQVLPNKCRDPRIFSVPCTIDECTFANAMLDLGASINVMSASIYRSLNFEDLESMGMTIQLANRSIVQPLGVLEDVLVQINELIFPADFYVLDMEDEASGKESTLILGRPFLMTIRTKIDVHAGTLSMEFDDTLVQFNIFEAMKHPTEDHSLFGIDMIEELVEENFQLDSCSEEMDPRPAPEKSLSPPPSMELKLLLSDLKYAYLDSKKQVPIIIANNLTKESPKATQEAIGWKLSDVSGINPSICLHRILMEEDIKPIRQ